MDHGKKSAAIPCVTRSSNVRGGQIYFVIVNPTIINNVDSSPASTVPPNPSLNCRLGVDSDLSLAMVKQWITHCPHLSLILINTPDSCHAGYWPLPSYTFTISSVWLFISYPTLDTGLSLYYLPFLCINPSDVSRYSKFLTWRLLLVKNKLLK